MPLNHYVTLGRSGLRVSPFCLGAMTFGEDWGWGSSVAESEAIIDRFLERGGNFIDTANVYTKGHSEKIIGDYIGRDPRQARPRRSSPRSSSATSTRAIRTAAAPGARRSSRRASSRCAGCRPTTSISTGCTAGTGTRRSKRRCARSTIWCGGQGPLPRLLRHAGVEGRAGADDRAASAAGRRWSRCRSSTRCSSAPSRASSSRWRSSWASASRRGRRCESGVLSGKYTRENAARPRPIAASGSRSISTRRSYAIIDELARDRPGARARRPARSRSRGCRAGRASRRRSSARARSSSSTRTSPALDVALTAEEVARLDELLEAGAQLPRELPEVREHVHARRRDGERREVDGLAAAAEERRRAVLNPRLPLRPSGP